MVVFLEEIVNIHNLRLYDGFLNVTPNKPVTKEKIDKHISSQWKTFVLKKTYPIPCFAMYNVHFFAQIFEGNIRMCIIHGQY